MNAYTNTVHLLSSDHPRTLFPLTTNKFLAEVGAEELGEYIYSKIALSDSSEASFLPQERVYATKRGLHLRRTHKLDPVAEFFMYNLAWTHRMKFRGDVSSKRRSFGYRFSSGTPVSPSDAYREFKSEIQKAANNFKFYLQFDVANYFNSIYHHDLSSWFSDYAESDEANNLFGKFFRQINSGRSIDCLTQGIIPSKILGSQFLKFVDLSPRIKAPLLLRFMDDFYLFSDDTKELADDFLSIQELIGEKGLSVNPSKTELGETAPSFVEQDLDKVRKQLLEKRLRVFRSSDDVELYIEEDVTLTGEQEEYLFSILEGDTLEEDDAELVLALMREHGNDLLKYLERILVRFPHLTKNIAIFCDSISDLENLSYLLLRFLKSNETVPEYQLFWIAKIVENKLLSQKDVSELITLLYEHQFATKVSRAKVLEIRDNRFGLRELRSEQLRSGASDWLTWSSAVGCLAENKATRNHSLGYFANCSQMNNLIATIVKKSN